MAANGYVRLMGEGPEAKVFLLRDEAVAVYPSLEDGPLGGGVFAETMESLTIPRSLQPHYNQIYWSLADSLRSFVIPENAAFVQRVFDQISALMDAGGIDDRGPTGLIIYMLRKSSQVPHREFARG